MSVLQNLLHIFRTFFNKNTSGWLLLNVDIAEKNITVSSRPSRLELKAENTISSWDFPSWLET